MIYDNTMIYPPIKDVVKKLGESCSRYDLVIAAAKRAREISAKNLENHIDDQKLEKPITTAVKEIMDDDFYIIHGKEDNIAPIPDTESMVIDLNSEEHTEMTEDEEPQED